MFSSCLLTYADGLGGVVTRTVPLISSLTDSLKPTACFQTLRRGVRLILHVLLPIATALTRLGTSHKTRCAPISLIVRASTRINSSIRGSTLSHTVYGQEEHVSHATHQIRGGGDSRVRLVSYRDRWLLGLLRQLGASFPMDVFILGLSSAFTLKSPRNG